MEFKSEILPFRGYGREEEQACSTKLYKATSSWDAGKLRLLQGSSCRPEVSGSFPEEARSFMIWFRTNAHQHRKILDESKTVC